MSPLPGLAQMGRLTPGFSFAPPGATNLAAAARLYKEFVFFLVAALLHCASVALRPIFSQPFRCEPQTFFSASRERTRVKWPQDSPLKVSLKQKGPATGLFRKILAGNGWNRHIPGFKGEDKCQRCFSRTL